MLVGVRRGQIHPELIRSFSGPGRVLRPLVNLLNKPETPNDIHSSAATQTRQLSIPIYLNQRIVFDLLATVEEGFSELRTIRTSESIAESDRNDVGAKLGISNAFGFIDVGLNSGRTKQGGGRKSREVSEERVFTPASLFSRLRNILITRELLAPITSDCDHQLLCPETFVEFPAILRKNPVIDAFESLVSLFEFASVFQPSQPRALQAKSNNGAGRNIAASTPASADVLKLVKGFLENSRRSQRMDLVATMVGSNTTAVVPIELDYFTDKTPASIIDGQFVVLGKIVRAVAENQGAIQLLRGTELACFRDEALETLVDAFASANNHGIRMPTLVTKVQGPAIQVIPIAIYA